MKACSHDGLTVVDGERFAVIAPTGLTDYRSQSRMRGDCLFYEEKVETTAEEKVAKSVRRRVLHLMITPPLPHCACSGSSRRASDPLSPIPEPIRRKDRPSKPNGLTKQTYSANAYVTHDGIPKKWHLVAYFRVCKALRSMKV